MLNKDKISRSFSDSAESYDKYADIQKEMMVALLNYLPKQAENILDVGSGTGLFEKMLSKKYPNAKITGIDIAPGMVKYAKLSAKGGCASGAKNQSPNVKFFVADGESLPFKDSFFDLVVSSAALQWMDPVKAFREAARVLRPKGGFYFATFGPATLHELKDAGLSINEFPDKNHLKLFLKKYFDRASISSRKFLKTYKDVFELFFYLKEIGAQSPSKISNKGLLTKSRLNAMLPINSGRAEITYEIYYGRAFK